MRVDTKILDLGQWAFSGSSSEMSSLDQFEPRIYFLELATYWQPIHFFLLSYKLPTPMSSEIQIVIVFFK